ncbi:MAG: ABC-F family ATP-binding cassette domain-containing protein [Acholeplasmatales bacterium]|nr:ABC-F family ATP-binding cassette domain-containing protein [Acholeplasmatales bacterium]
MALLEVEGLKFKYTDNDLFNEVDFRILPHDHIVIVGDNGCGKSTFMNLICKNLIPDSGSIKWLNNVKYAYLDQHLKVNNDVTIKDYIVDVFKPLFDKEALMNSYYEKLAYCDEKEYDKYLNYANQIQEDLEKNNFYWIDSTLGNMINGLGISEYGMDTMLSKLSGGQRAKVYLAKLLLEAPDVLLMDEPTNFLDSAHIEWLSKYLKDFKKAFVVISHDEEFIMEIGEVIYNLSNKKMTRYNMPYLKYKEEKELRDEQYKNAYQNQQAFIKKTQEFIKKNIVRATTTKQAQSRRKMLERMEKLERPVNHSPMTLEFPFSKGLGQEVLKIKDLTVGYGDKKVLENLDILIKHNEKVVILGKNGVGKTTIIKTIMGIIPKLSGDFTWNPSADLNYFSQEEKFDDKTNAINYLRYYYHLKTDGELRSVLARAGIKNDLALRPLSELSGGEQTKVRLALMTMKKSNVLIFDEPTNHLDPVSKMELWESIDKFPGSVILVTHEDDFYEGLVDLKLEFSE